MIRARKVPRYFSRQLLCLSVAVSESAGYQCPITPWIQTRPWMKQNIA